MVLYRVVDGEELRKLMQYNNDYYNMPAKYGKNTFQYNIGTEYMHFFRYAQHADIYKSIFGIVIMQVDIPDELIDQIGFGYYTYKHDILEHIVIPECIIKKDNFDVKFIKDFQIKPSIEWCYPNANASYTYKELYEAMLLDLYNEYKVNRKYASFNAYLADTLKDKDIEQLMLEYVDKMEAKKIESSTKKKSLFKLFKV